MDENDLHIYPQMAWHDGAAIVGTRCALESLRETIDQALAEGNGNSFMEAFVNDGEGYELQVSVVESMDGMALPYADEMARETRDERIWPFDLAVQRGDINPTKLRPLSDA